MHGRSPARRRPLAGLSLFGAGAAQAQRPEKLGDGIKTGQLGVQMFNYGGYISSGGNTGAANPITGVSRGLRDRRRRPSAGWSGSRTCSSSSSRRA